MACIFARCASRILSRRIQLPARYSGPGRAPDRTLGGYRNGKEAMRDLDSRQRAVLLIIMASYLMIVLDVSIVLTGLPKIRATMEFSRTALSWVSNAYTLAFGGLLLLGARAGDLFGRRRMFLTGLGVFTLASVAIGAAPNAVWLIAARAVQGAGAALLAPATLALLTTHFAEGPERARAIGYYAAIAGIGASLGLVLGGLLADLVSWRAGFFINLPVGLLLAWGARRYLVESEHHSGELDLASAASSTFGMCALVYGLVNAAERGWQDAGTLAGLSLGLALLALLVANEARASHPLLPLRLFADRERAGAYGARLLFLGGMGGFWFFTTQLLQGVLGYRPALAGLAFLPTTVPNFFAALLAPRLTRRFGNANVLLAGMALSVLGMAWLAQAGPDTAFVTGVALPMALIGVGQGACLGPLTVAGMAGVSPRDAGAGSGLVNVAHQLGLSLGLAILVVVFAGAHAASTGITAAAVLADSISAALFGATLLLALSWFAVAFTTRWRSAAQGVN
jgi:EmrB/QacA subfamily drug resistance transporter